MLIEKETVFLLRENKIIKNIFPKGYDNIIQFTFNKRDPNYYKTISILLTLFDLY